MMLRLATILLLSYLGFGAYLFLLQDNFLYFPTAPITTDKLAHDMLDTGDARIKVWRVNPGQRQALLYFGGNAENVFYPAQDVARQLPNHTVYLLNYRGYSGSSGKPAQQALFEDARLLFDHYHERHDELAVMGRSLGSGVATHLASIRPVSHLVLASPYDSVLALAQDAFPYFPISLMLRDHYDSLAYAPAVEAPTLLLLAANDIHIPNDHSLQLAEGFIPGLVQVKTFAHANHNNLANQPGFWSSVRQFLTTEQAAGIH